MSRLTTLAIGILLFVGIAACGGKESPKGTASGEDDLAVEVASYEIVANRDSRFIVGLLTSEQQFVSYGSVQMDFYFLGNTPDNNQPEFVGATTATFLPIPGEAPQDPPSQPVAGPPSQGRGVYVVDPLSFNAPGYWGVQVTVSLGNKQHIGGAAFEVIAAPQVPGVDDKAILSQNHIVGSEVPLPALDSRAGPDGRIPDTELHQKTIKGAVEQGRPALVVFSTPVFCVSKFCGPVTDMVADLQKVYGQKVDFIHIEIWRDYQKQVANQVAADWLLRGQELREPWVFLIDGDGTITKRWDNVASRSEIEPHLQQLAAR